tara:strand:- start:12209 stop:13498 length:1290 start_codon:yes stop_codon:yes gene_type:complete
MHKRRARRLYFVYSRRWQRRLMFVVGGLIVGAAAVGLAIASDFVQDQFHRFTGTWPYAPLIVTPLGFALTLYLTNRFFPNSGGSGIPQAIAARVSKDVAWRQSLVSLRIAAGKIVLTLLGLMVGASTGREGPTVQVGASVMFAMGRFSKRHQPGLILAGAAAGVAAAFNTPLAGIVFGIEEMSRSFEVRASGLVIGTIIAAGLTSLAFMGNYTYFGTSAAVMPFGYDWLAVVACGVVGGLLGGLFSRLLILFAFGFPGRFGDWVKANPILFAGTCGLAVAICGIASGGTVYGTGYEQARAVLHDQKDLSFFYAPLKFLATMLSSISGIPGGIFSPSLSVGAGIGADMAWLFPTTPIGALVLLGMVSYFSGVVQAPITAFVIVAEMTDNHSLMVPLMLAALVAQGASRLVCKEGIYHALSKKFIQQQPSA